MTLGEAKQHLLRVILKRAGIGAQLIRNDAVLNVSGKVLYRQTGHLARSISARAYLEGSNVAAVVGTDVFYGAIWEGPGPRKAYTVTAKPGHALAIPVFQLIGKGIGKKLSAQYASQFGGVFGLRKRDAKGNFISTKSGKFSLRNTQTGYIFRQHVHIPSTPAKPWLRPAVDARLPEILTGMRDDLAHAEEAILCRDIVVRAT